MVVWKRVGIVIAVALGVGACQTSGGLLGFQSGDISVPYGQFGSEKPEPLDPTKFRGKPVVQVSFVAEIDQNAEPEFLTAYLTNPIIDTSQNPSDSTDSQFENTDTNPTAVIADYSTASTNLKGMSAKNVFYAFHLAKYLKVRSKGAYTVVLNPQTLKYDSTRGFYKTSFENVMPPYDVDISFGTYVHPNSKPSTIGDLYTTYGDMIAPIFSVRVDPAFSEETGGAIALTRQLAPGATNADGRGVTAQLSDYLNFKTGKASSFKLGDRAISDGVWKPGTFFALSLDSYDLSGEEIPKTVLTPDELVKVNYNPGDYDAFEIYEGIYQIIETSLPSVDSTKTVTTAQREYWGFFDQRDMTDVMLKRADRGKRRFLVKAKQVELAYLEDRDRNWMSGVLRTNDFQSNFNNLRDAERRARREYINAQIQAAAGMLLAIGGAAAAGYSSSQNNSYGTVGGIALTGVGIGMVVVAQEKIEGIDTAFETAFDTAYESQKDYIFETAEGEREKIRAVDYADFKGQLRDRYRKRFAPTS